jgi:hypothetical protein
VAEGRDRALSPVRPAALPPQDRAVVTDAVRDAGVSTFHLSAVIGAVMLALAGLLGGLLLRNCRRPTAAARCPGGQLVGAPEEAGRGAAVAEPAAA